MRSTEPLLRGRFQFLERGHGLAEMVERRAVVPAEVVLRGGALPGRRCLAR